MMKIKTGATVTTAGDGDGGLELRPGGMVVQRRTDNNSNVPRVIRIRVKYGSVHHAISINSQSSFGELKKILSGETGVHHQDMKILYKDKERDSNMFLDLSGVKDGSKLVLKEDPVSREKRFLEMRKIAVKEKALKTISDVSFQVDRLAGKLSTVIGKRGKVEEKDLEDLMVILMSHLVKLEEISGDGEVKLKKMIQEERLKKYVEALDVLKNKNSMQPQKQPKPQTQTQQELLIVEEEVTRKRTASSSGPPVIITTKWETFDSNSNFAAAAEMVKTVNPTSKWELFD